MATSYIPTILAGDENSLPDDFPSNRLDPSPGTSAYNFVGGLAISSGQGQYRGTASSISPGWLLTAAHNVDLDGNGRVDAGLALQFHLPTYGVFSVSEIYVHPSFTGFANPSVNDDLALLRLSTSLPSTLNYPSLMTGVFVGDRVSLVGYGQSGFGSYGYTSSATLTDRRIGANVIDAFELDDEGSGTPELFLYDFDAPATLGFPGGSLGNDQESIIGPGDSGGPALLQTSDGLALVGVNTFTEGGSGIFGERGGGVLVEPYLPWISQTTGLAVPEPSTITFLGFFLLSLLRRNRHSI
jgi:secreted trypsin-like serine protease